MRSVVNNLTRDTSTVVTHIIGAAPHLQDNLRTIHEGCKMIISQYDGSHRSARDTDEFKNLAKQVFRFIQEQKPGRKIFLVNVTSPHMGLDTMYFAYFLTTRVVTQTDLVKMTPFLDSLWPTEVPTTPVQVDQPMSLPQFLAPALPPIPFSPVLPAPDSPVRPSLVRQSTNLSAAKSELDVDSNGFWDLGSDFDAEAVRANQMRRAESPKTPSKSIENEPINILSEIFDIKKLNDTTYMTVPLSRPLTPYTESDMMMSVDKISCRHCPSDDQKEVKSRTIEKTDCKHKNHFSNLAPLPAVPNVFNDNNDDDVLHDAIGDITPIITTPMAAKENHRSAKSGRLNGRRGSRHNRPAQQRRNSFENLPSQTVQTHNINLNATVPVSNTIEAALENIMERLSSLETSINKSKVNQTLKKYSPPRFSRRNSKN